MLNLTDRAEETRRKRAEYERLPHRREKSLAASYARAARHKIMTTKKRLEEHSMDDLMYISRLRCQETGADFSAMEEKLRDVFLVFHEPTMFKAAGVNDVIPDQEDIQP